MKFNDVYKKIEALDEALLEQATASINMSGDSAEDVIKLMKALKGDEGPSMDKPEIKPLAPIMGPPEDDMAKLRDIVKGPDMDKDMDDLKPGKQGEPCKVCGKNHLGASDAHGSDTNTLPDGSTIGPVSGDAGPDGGMQNPDESYENEPDEKYQDHNYMTKDINADSGDFGQKKSYKPTNGADNPMALEDELKAELAARLAEYMKEEDDGCPCCGGGECECAPDCPDCDCDGRNQTESSDAESDMEKCPECGSKRKKLTACGSCGCS